MIAVAAHPDPDVRVTLTSVLEAGGWTIVATPDPDEAVAACRLLGADVLLAGGHLQGGAPALLDRIKRDAEVFRTAVVLMGDDINTPGVVDWLRRGGADILRLPFTASDVLARASAAARTKALVTELTVQSERLEELVLFDELTGLRNRRAVLHELNMVLAGARRHGHDVSVLMLDIDHFKAINDRHGHRAGDAVLREMSRRVLDRLRLEDVAGRLGGDELLVALPDTDGLGASILAESIRATVADNPVEIAAGSIAVTLSIGRAQWEGEELNVLLERADRAMYAAKTAGRNSVSTD